MLFRSSLSVVATLSIAMLLGGCASVPVVEQLVGPQLQREHWDRPSETFHDLKGLPAPRGRIVASVYNFRDLTGQYKQAPASSFSTAVSQGAASMLLKAIRDSGWFSPLEREGLQDLLTERKIIRAALKSKNRDADVPPLLGANLLFEGGIIGYETNMKTGGVGAKYFGIGGSEQYRVDQVTVNLRVVDVNSGRVINSVTTTRSILSRSIQGGAFRFVRFKRLLELEGGYTRNEPVQLCLLEAIQDAVMRIIAEGVEDNSWALNDKSQINDPLLFKYGRRVAPIEDVDVEKQEKRIMLSGNGAHIRKTHSQNKMGVKTLNDASKESLNDVTSNSTALTKIEATTKLKTSQPSDVKRNTKPKENSIVKIYPASKSNSIEKVNPEVVNADVVNADVVNTVAKIAPAPLSVPKVIPMASRVSNPSSQAQSKAVSPSSVHIDTTIQSSLSNTSGPYAIQLISSGSSKEIFSFVDKNKLSRNMIKYLHYTVKGKPHFAILYGKFKSKLKALHAIESLPPQLRIYEPWVRVIEA